VLFNKSDKIRRCVARDGRFGEVRIRRDKIFDAAVKVREIAASAAGDQDFLAEAIGTFQHGDAAAALAGLDGAHQTRRAAAEDEGIEGVDHLAKVPEAQAFPTLHANRLRTGLRHQ
jgi:hypothetical protein